MTAYTIRYQPQTLLGYSLSVNTIRKFNRILIQANVMSIQAKNRLIVLGIDHSELNCIENLRSSIHVTNTYIAPKVRYTKFYPLILDGLNTTTQTTKKGDYILEHYMASHNYTNTNNQYSTYTYKFHKSKVTTDLGISIKTYYTKLKSLVTKQIISKTKLVKKSLSKITDFKYTNIFRVKVIDVLQPILTDLRIQIYSHKYHRTQIKKIRAQIKSDSYASAKPVNNNYKYYLIGTLGQYMTKYNVTYCKFMNRLTHI